MGSLAAIAVLGTLAWMQNMLTAPIGIGWMYFAMLMSLALIVPFGLIVFNLIATMIGGALRMRAPLLFALGAISSISIGLAAEIEQSMVAAAWELKNTTDATAATHFALVGGAVFGGFAALHYWFPKMTGRTMGENLARISFWTMALGILLAFVPLFLAGGEQGQVIDAYKFFDGTGVNVYNLIASIGTLVLAVGIVMTLVNAIPSRVNGPEAGHDPWGGETLEWFTLSPPEPHNFDVLPDVRSARPMRDIRDAIAHRTASTERAGSRVPAGSLTGMEAGAGAQTAPTPTAATAAPRSAAMTVVRDYLTLTKPKVQSLLLFTTVTTMYVAGDPSLGLILLTCLGGALSAGGAGAINHAVDRDIDHHDGPHRRPPGRLRPRLPRRRDRLRRRCSAAPPSPCWR